MARISLTSRIDIKNIRQDRASKFWFNASAEECAELVERFGFLGVNSLAAELKINKSAHDSWDVSVHLTGEVVQACCVTREPVSEPVDFLIEERYVRSLEKCSEIEVSLDGAELLQDDNIDVGEMLAQSLAISVTAWPRAPAAPEQYATDEEESDHPFAGLADMKNWRPE